MLGAVLFIAALAPVPDAAVSRARLVQGWIADSDYPAAARSSRQQGTTRIRYTVGLDGRVARCEIAESSGSAVLDATSCTLVTERFVFEPARGANGLPRREDRTQRIVWRLPVPVESPPNTTWEPGEVRLYLAPRYGSAVCAVETTGRTFEDVSEVSCQAFPRENPNVIARTADARFIVTRLHPDGAAPIALPAVPGRQVARAEFEIVVNTQGRIAGCSRIGVTGAYPLPGAVDFCSPTGGPATFIFSPQPGPERRGRIEVLIHAAGPS